MKKGFINHWIGNYYTLWWAIAVDEIVIVGYDVWMEELLHIPPL